MPSQPATLQRCAACAALLLAMLPLWAESWYTHYQNALKLVEQKNWPQVCLEIQQAIADKPLPALNARVVGLNFIDYLPYYYLGMAYYQQGMWAQARDAFEKSLEYNAVRQRKDLLANLERWLGECRVFLTKAVEPPPSAPRTTAAAHIEAGDTLVSGNRFAEARREYGLAVDVLEQGKNAPDLLDVVKRKLQNVDTLERLAALIAEAGTRIDARDYPAAEKVLLNALALDARNAQAQTLLDSLRRLRESQPPALQAPAVAADQAALNRLLQEGRDLFTAGDRTRAREKFAAVLQFAPTQAVAREWIEKIDLAAALARLQDGIRWYYSGADGEAERALFNAERFLSGDPVRYRQPLLCTRQFQVALAINRLLLADAQVDHYRDEAVRLVRRHRALSPVAGLEPGYFPDKVCALYEILARAK
jgi:tetratricopeptide (TPR) repeat protein